MLRLRAAMRMEKPMSPAAVGRQNDGVCLARNRHNPQIRRNGAGQGEIPERLELPGRLQDGITQSRPNCRQEATQSCQKDAAAEN